MVNDKNISTKYVEKTYNKSYVMNIIEQLVLELRKKGIPFECSIDEKGTGGAYRDEGTIKGGRHHKIDIHIGESENQIDDDLLIKIIEGTVEDIEEQFNEKQIMGIASTIFHEYRHLEQTENFKYNPDFSSVSKAISIMNAIQTNGFANYYYENYRNDLKELDAAKYGIEEAVKFIKNNFPEIDAEKGIIEDIKDYIDRDKDDEYGFHMFDKDRSNTVEGILGQLQERIDNPTRVNLDKVLRNAYIPDKPLKKAFTDEFVEKYNNCSSSIEQDTLILAEIIKLYPEILQEYPILLNEEKQVSYQEPSKPIVDTQRLGKETLDMQKNTSKIDEIEQQMNTQMITQDLENGTLDNEEHKKKDSHKVEKGDEDYVM